MNVGPYRTRSVTSTVILHPSDRYQLGWAVFAETLAQFPRNHSFDLTPGSQDSPLISTSLTYSATN